VILLALLVLTGPAHGAGDSAPPVRPTLAEPGPADLPAPLNLQAGVAAPTALVDARGLVRYDAVALPPTLYRFLADQRDWGDRYHDWAIVEIAEQQARGDSLQAVLDAQAAAQPGPWARGWQQAKPTVAYGLGVATVIGVLWGLGQIGVTPTW
jgi:hypothetical protein